MEKARVIMNYTGMVFDYAIRLQLITLNPTKVIKKPAPKAKNQRRQRPEFLRIKKS